MNDLLGGNTTINNSVNLSKSISNPTDRLKIRHFAAEDGNINELSPEEAINVMTKGHLTSKGCNKLDKIMNTQGGSISLLASNFQYTAEATGLKTAFIHKFAETDALAKTTRSFPIRKISDLKDPKTKGMPTIAAPKGTPISKIISPDLITDKKVKNRVENGAKVGDISEIPIKGGKVGIVAFSKATPGKDGVNRVDVSKISNLNFLIYLPTEYMVATSSGIHREMYPHDSSYVIEALVKNPTTDNMKKAKNMLDAVAYQVKNFGFVLNGNRGYYLTRTQTNNLITNIWQYYKAAKKAGVANADIWLKNVGIPTAKKIHSYWHSGNGEIKATDSQGHTVTGNRWIARGEGPCQEVWESHGVHKAYYFRVLDELVKLSGTLDAKRPGYAKGFKYKSVVRELTAS